MSVVRRTPPKVRNTMVQSALTSVDPSTNQSHQRLASGVQQLEANASSSSKVMATLIAGANVVNHGLGRIPTVVHVTPSVADVTFAYALTTADKLQATVTTVGGAQTNCTLRFE